MIVLRITDLTDHLIEPMEVKPFSVCFGASLRHLDNFFLFIFVVGFVVIAVIVSDRSASQLLLRRRRVPIPRPPVGRDLEHRALVALVLGHPSSAPHVEACAVELIALGAARRGVGAARRERVP